jgi:hypothetical protein
MKKVLLVALISVASSLSFYSCKSTGGGGCDAFGGSHSMTVVKHVGKSI